MWRGWRTLENCGTKICLVERYPVIISTLISTLSTVLHFYLLHSNSTFVFNRLLIIILVKLNSIPKFSFTFIVRLYYRSLRKDLGPIITLFHYNWFHYRKLLVLSYVYLKLLVFFYIDYWLVTWLKE